MRYPEKFDVIVIGGGHAGVEAALAASRMGASTLLLTQAIETIGQMSCNPAIGGIGKSHLVREIDALGGAMALAADAAGIQFRTLNSRKGPAVRATRAQTDRVLYRQAIRSAVESQCGLRVLQETVEDLDIRGDRVHAVVTRLGMEIEARTVVLTTGTFLGGRIFVGREQHTGGRAGDPAATTLAANLRRRELRVGRLKTGTPPRIDGTTVDFSKLAKQPGDEPCPVLSYLGTAGMHPKQVPCHIGYTNPRTHAVIREALDESPMFSGDIEGVGPRYCPSIEDKVVRFAEREQHQIFVEPEGLNTPELYPNGISTSLPFRVQHDAVRTIKGFENAHITRPGYAIEYDFFDPRDLHDSLETRSVEGLFFAGQINGTTGYEEAAAQGLLAGLNAARKVASRPSWCPQRHEAYLGVLVDDLTTRGTNEPYRMFTSRAEYRLRLRQDNADFRLTPQGRKLGLVDDHRWHRYRERSAAVETTAERLAKTTLRATDAAGQRLASVTDQSLPEHATLLELIKRPSIGEADLLAAGLFDEAEREALEQAVIDAKYSGYVKRHDRELARLSQRTQTKLPSDLDYNTIQGLSTELREKLHATRPLSVAKAARIPGMTPAALSLLAIHAKKRQEERKVA